MFHVKVHHFDTLLVQEKVQSLGILRLRDTHISRECVLQRINNCSASLGHGLDQVVNHLCEDGHPPLLEYLRQLTHICRGVQSASNKSLQLVPSLFVWVTVWGHGRPGENCGRCCWQGILCCCVLHGVLHCRVEVQCHRTFEA